ncbi:hypothetical protein JOQ06_013103, partial [Pogonophryne albipinna]
ASDQKPKGQRGRADRTREGNKFGTKNQLQTQTPPQQQCQLSSASARYPPREVPPRFRQQEHKQLLKRGQPLP